MGSGSTVTWRLGAAGACGDGSQWKHTLVRNDRWGSKLRAVDGRRGRDTSQTGPQTEDGSARCAAYSGFVAKGWLSADLQAFCADH